MLEICREDSGAEGISVDEIARGKSRRGERKCSRTASILFFSGERGIAQVGGAWMYRTIKTFYAKVRGLVLILWVAVSHGRRLCRSLKNKVNTQSILLRILEDCWRGL